MVVSSVDKRDRDGSASEGACGVKSAKTTANNHDARDIFIVQLAPYFRPELTFCEAETPAAVGLTGITTGAALSFSRNTTNFAGFVALAFRPTV